jgi:tetratricopeptide (TPR) repeat protein
MTSASQNQPLQAFIVYAHEDKRLRAQLEKHMSVLRNKGVISVWYDGKIVPGQEWDKAITENLKASRVFLLLVSSDFLASDYINHKEMDHALKMHDAGLAVVIPIILRSCDWRETRLKDLQALPSLGKPVIEWPKRDKAWTDVVQGIRRAVDDLRAKLPTGGGSSPESSPSPVSPSSGPATGATQPEITSGASTLTIKSLHQLRAPVSDFVGRELEIDQLVQALSKATKSSAAAISGARGMGGIGKSELAYAVAQRLTDTFPDAQLLLELRGASDNPLTPEQALQTIIRAFEPLAQLPADLNGLRSIYLSLLNGKRVLVLADDARDAKQVEALLPPSGCAMLLTSRQRFDLRGMKTVDLEILSQPEAEKLLQEICPSIGSAASRMAKLCGCLPLALRLSAGLCANSAMSIEHQLEALERTRLALLRDPDNPNDPTKSVEASFQLSYDALDLPAQQVLCQLSVFPASFDKSAANAVVDVPGTENQEATTNLRVLEKMLDLLYRRSLLDWNRQTGRYSLHDLVRVFAVAQLEGEDAIRMRHAQYYTQIAALANDLYLRGGENLLLGLKLFDEERANIDAGWNWAREQAGSASQEVDELLLDYADATVYVGDLRYNTRQELIPQIEAAAEAARRLSLREAEGRALGNLGIAYSDLGETRKAIQYYEQVLGIVREIGDRRSEGRALGNLGLAYAGLGELRKAIHYYEQRLEFSPELGDHRGEGNVLGNLGLAYAGLGEPRKAIQYYEQQLEIAREIGDRRGEGRALGNLGNAYQNLGERSKALQYYEERLEIAREIGDRQGEAIASWNLGILLAQEGDLARAIELMQVKVDYEREIGHVDAEKDAAIVEEMRRKLTEKSS